MLGGSRGAAAPDGALIRWRRLANKNASIFACLGSWLARTLRILAPRSRIREALKNIPVGYCLMLGGSRGARTPDLLGVNEAL